jgi:hypothetical protein
LRKSDFEGPQLQFRNFFSPQFRNRIGSPQYCGIAEVRTKIADAHLWQIQKGKDFLEINSKSIDQMAKPNFKCGLSPPNVTNNLTKRKNCGRFLKD